MSKRKLDLTNVETFVRMSEGVHRVKVVSCEDKESQSGDDMLVIAFEAVNGDDKGARLYDNFVLTDKALWKLKQFLQAIGIKCDGKIVLDTDKLIGKICDVEVFHEEYNGQLRAKAGEYTKAIASRVDDDEDFDDDEEEEETPAPKAKKKPTPAPKKSPKKSEPEEEEDDEDEDWDEDDEEEEPTPKKKPAAKSKPAPKAKKKPEPEDFDDDEDDWEDA